MKKVFEYMEVKGVIVETVSFESKSGSNIISSLPCNIKKFESRM